MAAFVPHRSNKYFHVMASNGIVSSCLIYHRCISNRTGFGYSNCAPNVVGARSSVLNHHRFWGYTSGPSSSRNTLPSTIHGHAACRSALPRERFSPLARNGRTGPIWLCPLTRVDRKWLADRLTGAIDPKPHSPLGSMLLSPAILIAQTVLPRHIVTPAILITAERRGRVIAKVGQLRRPCGAYALAGPGASEPTRACIIVRLQAIRARAQRLVAG